MFNPRNRLSRHSKSSPNPTPRRFRSRPPIVVEARGPKWRVQIPMKDGSFRWLLVSPHWMRAWEPAFERWWNSPQARGRAHSPEMWSPALLSE